MLDVFSTHISSLSTTISATQHADVTPPPAFDPATRTATLRFIRRRIKLLRNILLWRRQAPNEVRALIERILGEVLVPVMSKAWDSGAREMSGQVSLILARLGDSAFRVQRRKRCPNLSQDGLADWAGIDG